MFNDDLTLFHIFGDLKHIVLHHLQLFSPFLKLMSNAILLKHKFIVVFLFGLVHFRDFVSSQTIRNYSV